MPIPARRRFISLTLAACAAGLAASRTHAQDDERADGLAYGTLPRQRLDVYAPDLRPGAARPVVVYFYGGSWQAGERADAHGIGETLAEHGIVTVAPDYRVFPDTIFPGFVDDAAAAVRWTRDHAREFGADPGRIVVMGHSAGAHIAALVATDPRYLAAHGMSKASLAGMIGLAGPYAAIPPREPHMAEIFPATLRGRTLPIDFVTGNEPPMLLATGTADTVVDPRNSERFADALRARDDSVELKTYPGYGHGQIVDAISASRRDPSPVLADVIAFIGAH
ncbi:alpha/beta hydrolase [Caballeronia insecticola]|uniref:Alpha/beta hydrolase fold-3 domain protein n=1 Tax=Caballeronia insecticola TaxID=758793 RepID=R4WFP4_9BURK|nr:alpha/beta hydrolase [Caballeronia insecticola]BAN22359.1 alpha/beta hydrolase fold-3 domain protein [Caballeronia insecticola]